LDIAEQAGAWSANSWVHLRTVPLRVSITHTALTEAFTPS
jgi:hypothetical protein